MSLELTSPAFPVGGTIPKQYTGDGADRSPPLLWSEPPTGTKSLAVICDDPDAPRGTWVHWVVFNLPTTTRELDEGLPKSEVLGDGAQQGKTDFGKVGYGGPAPPKGKPHRYFFKLYALDTALDLPAGATQAQLESAMKGHVLAEGQLIGTYGRSLRESSAEWIIRVPEGAAVSEPQDQLAHLMSGYWYTQAIYVAARLKLADLLKDGPQTAHELAQATGASVRPLYRLLRALASVSIFTQDEQRRFGLTPMAECLRSDMPGSLWSMALLRGGLQYEAWGQLLHSVQTGQSAFEKLHGIPIFEYFSQHPEDGKLFDAAMTGVHGRETAAMLDAYDFSGVSTLADLGGGNGSLITAVLQRYPAMQGILLDLPVVVERARPNLEASGLSDRCRIVGGNFFEAVPPGADAYLMRHIIHDWDDDKSLTILRNCRKAMGVAGKVLVVEGVVPSGNEPSISKFFDLAMMVLPGGMERTEDEYRQLYEAAGFRLNRTVPTKTWISVIEGVPI